MIRIKNYRIGFAIGLLILSGGTLVNHYWHIYDFLNGTFIGLGLGVMLISLYKMKRVPAKKNIY